MLRKWRDLQSVTFFVSDIEQTGIVTFPYVSVLKRVLLQNLSYDNELDLHGNKRVDERQEYSI